jgi:hypothetical protein
MRFKRPSQQVATRLENDLLSDLITNPANEERFLSLGSFLLDEARQSSEVSQKLNHFQQNHHKKKKFQPRDAYQGDDERGSNSESEDSRHVDYRLSENVLFPWIEGKIQNLIKQFREQSMSQLTYTFPPFVNKQRAYIHRICKKNGITHQSGPSIPFNHGKKVTGKKPTLKQTHIVIKAKDLTVKFTGNKTNKRKETASAPLFVSGGVIQHQEQANIEIQEAAQESIDDDKRATPSFRMHAEFGEFMDDSGVGGTIMSMMAKMGYVEVHALFQCLKILG